MNQLISRAVGHLIAVFIMAFFAAIGALAANALFAFMHWRHL